MNLPPQSELTDAKYQEILELIRKLGVKLAEIEEKSIRGSGKGGQKINKTNNAVQLKHMPTGIMVKYQEFRDRPMNRILALRELLRKLGPDYRDQVAEKIRRQKKRRARRQSIREKVWEKVYNTNVKKYESINPYHYV